MDGISVVATVVSVLGGMTGLFFGLYRYGFLPQLKSLHKKIDNIKASVEENSSTLNHHGERLATLETDVKWLKDNSEGGEDDEKRD